MHYKYSYYSLSATFAYDPLPVSVSIFAVVVAMNFSLGTDIYISGWGT